MGADTPIYGHSRGYRTLAWVAAAALAVSTFVMIQSPGFSPVATTGTVGFGALFFYAWNRSQRRLVVLVIEEEGFSIQDPALMVGLCRYEEIEEIRIWALAARPMVAFRFHEPDHIRRRAPVLLRAAGKPFWRWRHYHIVVELERLDDQVAAIKSTAARVGIPVRSELL